jgi:hypothetical protein
VITLQKPVLVLVAFTVAAICGCTTAGSNNSANSNAASNSNKANVAAGTPAPANTAEAPATGSLATPTEAYKTAYSLREKKDVEGLKRVMSKDVMEFFEMMAKEDKKTVDDEMAQMFEKPQAKSPEVRNEKITDDTATIEYLDENGSWKTMDFVKEGADWKMSFPKADKPESSK